MQTFLKHQIANIFWLCEPFSLPSQSALSPKHDRAHIPIMNQKCVPIKLYSQKTKQAWRLSLAHFTFSTPWLCCLIKVSLSFAKTKTETDTMEQWFWQRNPRGTLWNGTRSYKIRSFPSWVSVLLWSNFSSLCLHPSFFEWYYIFCTKIY